jgi:hypothetical protein
MKGKPMATARKNAILIGLDPATVDYSKWPGLSADKLVAAMNADKQRLAELGIAGQVCFVDPGGTPEATVSDALREVKYDVVLIGAGVRTAPDHFLLFEKLVNVAHRLAPEARLCFNTGPTDSVAAVQRWL